MQWIIPGTTLKALRDDADRTENLFQSLFLAGGLTLSQVSSISGLEPYTIQNWVKRGFLASPVNKRYNMEQVCRILNINILKGAVPLEQIVKLMAYLNGDLTDESDDLVDETFFCAGTAFALAHIRKKIRISGSWAAARVAPARSI